MGTIATLAVSIVANTSSFTQGIASAESSVSRFNIASGVALGNFATAASEKFIEAGRAVYNFVSGQMEAIDVNAKLADRVGTSTEALAGLQHAADLAGVSNEKLGGALQRQQKSLGEASGGSETAIAAFDNIGLSVSNLLGMDSVTAFGAISDAINDLTSPAERAAAAADIYGKSGVELLNLMSEGSEGFAASAEEADKFGLSISRLDSAQVEIANDAITKLKGFLVGVGRAIAVNLSPFILDAATRMTDFGTQGGTVSQLVGSVFETIIKGAAKSADYFALLQSVWYTFEGVVLAIQVTIIKAFGAVGDVVDYLLEKVGLGTTGTGKYFNQLARITEQDMNKAGRKATEAFDTFDLGLNTQAVTAYYNEVKAKSAETAQVVADKATQMSQAFVPDNSGTMVNYLKDVAKFADKLFSDTRTPMEKFTTQIEKMVEAFELFPDKVSSETFTRGLDEAYKDLEKSLDKDKAGGKSSSFKQVTSQISVAGLAMGGKEQKVRDPQLATANAHLNAIKQKLDDVGKVGR